MSYEYEDELERMRNRKRPAKKRESDFINRHQQEFEERKIRRARALKKKRRKQKIMRMAAVLVLAVAVLTGYFIYRHMHDDGYWTIAVFGVDSRDGNLEKGALSDVEMICNVDFRRCAVLLQEGDTVCELALDEGTLRHGGRTAPLCEIELEYVAGGEQTFHDLAAELADQLELVPEPESKLARAMKL